ncbi:MAG: indolepyruvate oxidoreductase subunit beta [Rhodospirillaceae bacterium]
MSQPTFNILLCGIGGQGVMTAAEVLAQVAAEQGLDVKKTEVAGMAQRGGVVTSHVRFGEQVLAAAIPPGQADVLLGFEVAEALRWTPMLKPGGVALVNTMRIAPPVVSGGLFTYPSDPESELRARASLLHMFDAENIARSLGNLRLINTVMLGAAADHLPFGAELVRKAVVDRFTARKPALAEANAQAFEAGRAASSTGAAAA